MKRSRVSRAAVVTHCIASLWYMNEHSDDALTACPRDDLIVGIALRRIWPPVCDLSCKLMLVERPN